MKSPRWAGTPEPLQQFSSGKMTEPQNSVKAQLRSQLPPALNILVDLAFNFWWSWSSEATSLFRDIDAQLWDRCGQNPVKFLLELPETQLMQVATDPTFRDRTRQVGEQFQHYMNAGETWATEGVPDLTPDQPIAYFCIEFGLHPCLKTYAGGLGILAADQLKSASDLGIPMVGVGLIYHHGYFEQHFNSDGWQEEVFPDRNFSELPLELVLDADGNPLTVEVKIRRRHVSAQVWRVRVGRLNLYLLDSDRDDNDPVDRTLTNTLYGGDDNTRIGQEILLGIGGVRLLEALNLRPSIYHFNEGHSAFAALELLRRRMAKTGEPVDEAKTAVRKQCVFTTHTPVMAGHDTFAPDFIDDFFNHYWPDLQLSRDAFLDLGARKPGDPWDPFNMTVLALRMSRIANGVSQLNGAVSRRMWSVLYPDRDVENVPITSITNGVHTPTWISPLMASLYTRHLCENWAQRACEPEMWGGIDRIPDGDLWQRHRLLKRQLVIYTRNRLKRARSDRREASKFIEACDRILDPDALTVGFARRFSPYKRGDLILHDPERALKIFRDRDRPVQIIFAGKAHPANDESKRIMQRLIEWSHDEDIWSRVVFLEDYDILTAKMLVWGVDVWLNTPRRPLEASGTSGQKVALNGGLNCSIRDGWWNEAYREDADGRGLNGWAIGDGVSSNANGHNPSPEDREKQDRQDAEHLYYLLENEIIPRFYDRDGENLPRGWIDMMKASIQTVAPQFNTDRMVKEYAAKMYFPDAASEFAEPALTSGTR